MTIQEAYEAMANVLPADESITIQLDCWWHYWDGQRGPLEAKFMVSHRNGPLYHGNTLEAAVQSFLAADAAPATSAADVDAIVKEVETTEQAAA
jgi:hypothetical protein